MTRGWAMSDHAGAAGKGNWQDIPLQEVGSAREGWETLVGLKRRQHDRQPWGAVPGGDGPARPRPVLCSYSRSESSMDIKWKIQTSASEEQKCCGPNKIVTDQVL